MYLMYYEGDDGKRVYTLKVMPTLQVVALIAMSRSPLPFVWQFAALAHPLLPV